MSERMRVTRLTLPLVLLAAALLPTSGGTQVLLQRVDVKKFTCAQAMALTGDERYRLLIYYNGYMDGRRGAAIWDDRVVGPRIDRVVETCKASPSLPLLDAFTKAWKP